ncbi:hypothetical protein LVJ94_21825 [Pendulispora rubella]|uniref:Uncharacterized protein n=1 Tax=Pendulispora rubella TaxID=2741070 RepID=A0ABZ2LJD6_9BACT
MRPIWLGLALATCAFAVPASAKNATNAPKTKSAKHASSKPNSDPEGPKPWCAPEVTELEEHVCYFDGDDPAKSEGRHTLVIYLHGSLATTPGFAWLQQRSMANYAKRHGFTVLLPTSPKNGAGNGYLWPTSIPAQREHEAKVLADIQRERKELAQRIGHDFDETFVVGFSSGAYYGSGVAVRGALSDVDGYVILAGGASPGQHLAATKNRAPIFVGVSASDRQTADDSRHYAHALAAMGWPHRVEERPAGHTVDPTFLSQALSWLRSKTHNAGSAHRTGG